MLCFLSHVVTLEGKHHLVMRDSISCCQIKGAFAQSPFRLDSVAMQNTEWLFREDVAFSIQWIYVNSSRLQTTSTMGLGRRFFFLFFWCLLPLTLTMCPMTKKGHLSSNSRQHSVMYEPALSERYDLLNALLIYLGNVDGSFRCVKPS